jgi:cytochrome c peroxidase
MKKVMLAMVVTAISLIGCGDNSGPGKVQSQLLSPPATQLATKLGLSAQVGQKIFFDKVLSGSGKMSCASCHDPQAAYASPNNLSVQLGGVDLSTAGTRAVPSLRYTQYTPAYADLLDNPDGISVPGPGGGFTWDGRANTLADQAKIPLLSSNEMANNNAEEVVAKLRKAPYAALFEQAFGKDALVNTDSAFANAMQALQAFQLEDPSFHPYTSKFDLYAGNKIGGNFTPAEARGLRVFSDPATGNCASCHYQGAGLNGSSGLFTDFSYEAISVPRNLAIAANQDPAYFDMGLCGPSRTDHLPASLGSPNKFCGMFKAPGLRNVATRNAFFHNGVMHSLLQVIRFYNTRDTMPEIWYPTVGGTAKPTPDASFPMFGLITTQYTGGTVQRFNDLPVAYRSNIDTQLPLDGRVPGSTTPMTDAQIADLICFLNTLTDGYDAAAQNPSSGACSN